MKITDVKVWLVRGIKYNWTLLKIYTDEGYTGVGEATNWPGSPIVFEAAKHAGQRIIGLDPMKTDFIWTKLYRDLNWIGPYGASLCAISGIDMALLDLKAKVLGVPCYELLGGAYRKDILLYANYWFTGGGHNEADYAAQARRVMDAGFTGLKFDPFAHTNYFYGEDLASNLTLTAEQQDLAFNVSKAVREAVGPECDIMIETHAMLNYRVAVKMAERLAKLDITWYEEPAGPESSQTLRAMRERIPSDVAICVGERHYTRFGIRSLLEKHVCDVIMPDITRCGGPSEMKRMATMAEAYNVLIAPHNPNGPLSTLASSHVCAAIPNFFRQEFMFNDVPWRDTVIDHPIAEMVYDGHLHLSDRPGLGVDLVEEEMKKHPGITTDAEELKGFVEDTVRTFGRIDMVVSNAGMNVFEGAEGCTEERWHYNLDLNLASHWRLARLCKPYLEKSGEGVLLLMTSNHAFSSIPGCFPYNVTKTAITGLVRSLAIEWGPAVRTVGVAPGFIDTAGNDTWFDSFPDPEAERRRTIDLHPVKRIGTVEEVGALCVYLVSPYARFISGTTILMDGGRSALMQDE